MARTEPVDPLAGVAAGRIVHYVLPVPKGPEGNPLSLGDRPHRAAHITSDWGGSAQNLTVFLDQVNDLPQSMVDSGAFRHSSCEKVNDWTARAWSVPYDESRQPGTWHWPERR
jgi:hypothetical protein